MSQSDSFITEVTEQVRREQFARWLRRWGWVPALLVVLILVGAGWWEWQRAGRLADAEARGDALLGALETPDAAQRLAALDAVPREGAEGVVAALLLAAEQQAEGDAEAAAATLEAATAEADLPQPYRDLAALKAQMIRGPEADRAALEALAAPGAPFRLLALETLAMADLGAGRRDEALAGLRAIRDDAETGAGQAARVGALLTALGEPAPTPDAPSDALLDAPVEG